MHILFHGLSLSCIYPIIPSCPIARTLSPFTQSTRVYNGFKKIIYDGFKNYLEGKTNKKQAGFCLGEILVFAIVFVVLQCSCFGVCKQCSMDDEYNCTLPAQADQVRRDVSGVDFLRFNFRDIFGVEAPSGGHVVGALPAKEQTTLPQFLQGQTHNLSHVHP